MPTLPASLDVNVVPSVISAGGSALQMSGLFLTQETRPPLGSVLSFANAGQPNPAANVSAYFGPLDPVTSYAKTYFAGFSGGSATPAAMLVAQYNSGPVPAYLRGGSVAALTLAQLQGISGTLTVTMDGYARTAAALNLSAATSFSSAATIIQTAINTGLPSEASATGSIAPVTSTFTASIAGNIMTVTSAPSSPLVVGAVLAGAGVTAGTQVASQISGAAGGIGVYAVSLSQVVASESVTATYGTFTAASALTGAFAVGQTLSGGTVSAGTIITALGTGTGGLGTYFVNLTQTVASATITGSATALAVAYDAVSGAFALTSGVALGAGSTAAYATGTTSAPLALTLATGAVLSQGAIPAQPASFMAGVLLQTQNWGTFTTVFDPDGGGTAGTGGGSGGNQQKLAFAQWVNSTADDFAFVCPDYDPLPTLSSSAPTSLGAQLASANLNGTYLQWQPSDLSGTAFICGVAASIAYGQPGGRTDFKFRSQTGLAPGVTSPAVAANLDANGYNYYAAVATANQAFQYERQGAVSGPFTWMDSYVNQIALNNALQLAALTYMTTVGSFPYTPQGYANFEGALSTVIAAYLAFGAYSAGTTLSSTQIQQVNAQAGTNIATTLVNQGWYLQCTDPGPAARAARQSPIIKFWYTDAGSVHFLNINSIDAQ